MSVIDGALKTQGTNLRELKPKNLQSLINYISNQTIQKRIAREYEEINNKACAIYSVFALLWRSLIVENPITSTHYNLCKSAIVTDTFNTSFSRFCKFIREYT